MPRSDAAQGARAVRWGSPDFLRIHVGPATWPCRWPNTSRVGGLRGHSANRRRAGGPAVGLHGQGDPPLRGVIINMSWFTGDDGRCYGAVRSRRGPAAGHGPGRSLSARSRSSPPPGGGHLGVPVTEPPTKMARPPKRSPPWPPRSWRRGGPGSSARRPTIPLTVRRRRAHFAGWRRPARPHAVWREFNSKLGRDRFRSIRRVHTTW